MANVVGIDWDALVLTPIIDTVFGESISYAPASGALPFQGINGVYDEAYKELDLATGMPFTGQMPVIGVRAAAFVALNKALPVQGDELTVIRTNESFTVKEVENDGHGWLKLKLNCTDLPP